MRAPFGYHITLKLIKLGVILNKDFILCLNKDFSHLAVVVNIKPPKT
jgi:hypothetical protein